MNELYREIELALRTGEPLVLATVAASRGSTPRGPGAKMAVRPDGSMRGTIGGGCGEAEVWQAAMETMRDGQPRLVTVDLTEDVEGEDSWSASFPKPGGRKPEPRTKNPEPS